MRASNWKNRIKREQAIQLFSFLGIIALGLLIIVKVNNMLVSSVLAFVITYLLSPIVYYFERKGLSRTLSVSILFLCGALGISLVVIWLLPLVSNQIADLKNQFPLYIHGLTRQIDEVETRLEFLHQFLGDFSFSAQAETYLRLFTKSVFEDIPDILSKSLTTALLAPLFAFFMLRDGSATTKKLFSLVPNNLFELFLNLQHQINIQLGGFIRARILEAAIVGFVTWVGLWIIGFPFATLLSLFAAISNLIPYVGPLVGMVPAAIIASLNGEGSLGVLIALTPYLIAQAIDTVFIIPVLVAKIVDLHAVTVVVSLIIGAQLMGVMGMIIAIPVTSILKVTLTNLHRHLVGFQS